MILKMAVTSIISPSISYLMKILLHASTNNQIVNVSKNTIEIIVPMTSDLCHPHVYSFDTPLRVNISATIEIMNPRISEARCAQSVAIAIELANHAPVP